MNPELSMALFVSDICKNPEPDDATVRAAVDGTLRKLGKDRCYADAAEVYGDRPELAVARMQWARATIARVFRPNLALR